MSLLLTPDGTLSYPNLFQPRMPPNPRPGQKARYNCVILFPKDMSEDGRNALRSLKKTALDAAKQKWGANTEKLIQEGTLRWPFSTKWTDKMGNQKYDPEKWQSYISPWSEQAPGIVSRYAGPNGKPAPIIDPREVYAGCIVRASLSVFVYEAQGNWGVNFGLQNIQVRGDGPRLDNRVAAEDSFTAEARPEVDMDADVSGQGESSGGTASRGGGGQKLADLLSD